jgi:hypothetical protein
VIYWMLLLWAVAFTLAVWPWGYLTARRRARERRRRAEAANPTQAIWPGRARRAPAVDPLVVLEVQIRLAELAAEVQLVESTPGMYAQAHHLRAALAAYDAMLAQACVLAGLPFPGQALTKPVPEEERERRELELSSRGWHW